MFKRRKTIVASLAIFIFAGAVYAYLVFSPVNIVVSPSTTFITEPLLVDGRVDYAEALNQRYGKHATPANNAVVLLWELVHEDVGSEFERRYLTKLGLESPAVHKPEFLSFDEYLRKQDIEYARLQLLNDQWEQAKEQPWTLEKHPEVVDWIAASEASLAKAVVASQRPIYYSPIISYADQPYIYTWFPTIRGIRDLGRALVVRAMLQLEAAEYEAAWDDLLTVYRLGALVGNSPTAMERMTQVAVQQLALQGMARYLGQTPLTTEQARDKMQQLQSVAPCEAMKTVFDLSERFSLLDSLAFLARYPEEWGEYNQIRESVGVLPVDWNAALRICNGYFDRLQTIQQIDDFAQRSRQQDSFVDDLRAIQNNPSPRPGVWQFLLRPGQAKEQLGEAVGHQFTILVFPNFSSCFAAELRLQQQFDLVIIGFQLAAHRTEHAEFPPSLPQLRPDNSALNTMDRFHGQPLIYRPSKSGYLLYSVGPNGQDDQAITITERESSGKLDADDVVIEVEVLR